MNIDKEFNLGLFISDQGSLSSGDICLISHGTGRTKNVEVECCLVDSLHSLNLTHVAVVSPGSPAPPGEMTSPGLFYHFSLTFSGPLALHQ